MSKAYGLPGLRVGWIASKDHALLSKMERIKHYLSICNAGPSEHLATIALKARDQVIGRNVTLLKDNLKAVESFFAEYPGRFQWYRPDGGCVAFPRYVGRGRRRDLLPSPGGRGRHRAAARLDLQIQPQPDARPTVSASASAAPIPRTASTRCGKFLAKNRDAA